MMLSQWIYYKSQIPIREIKDLCDLAIKLEKAKRKVERGIRLGFVYSQDFIDMQDLSKRLIYAILRTLRRFAGEKREKEVMPIADSLSKLLEFEAYERKAIAGELMEQTTNFPWVNSYIGRVNEVLHVYLSDVLRSAISIKKINIVNEFLLSSYNNRGITPSPKFLREIKLREEIE